MKKLAVLSACAACGLVAAVSEPAVIVPRPPIFRPVEQQTNEQPVAVQTTSEIVAANGLYRRVALNLVFTNPNRRVFEGELEFPVPAGATVCGYALEIDGAMEPGVVCPKEQARVAFENEKRRNVDPGLVEQVKGNVWKTRIHPLLPGTPRKARVEYVEPLDGAPCTVVEQDGADVFVGVRAAAAPKAVSPAERLRAAKTGWILWDASLSRDGRTAADRNLLECLPETGEWTLVVFRDVPEAPRVFTARADLLKAVDAAPCDGGTSLAALARVLPKGGMKFLFSDELDTLSQSAAVLENDDTIVFASRPASPVRPVSVRKLAAGEKPPAAPRAGTLLATAWAANRIADLAGQADARAEEFLALGRRYGVASSVTSLIVLESLEQYVKYRIEPPAASRFHAQWVAARAAEDDPIAAKKAKADHEKRLLDLWEERVKWWNDPIPKKVTPKSGLFDRVRSFVGARTGANDSAVRADAMVTAEACESAPARASAPGARAARTPAKSATAAPAGATVTIAAWDPKMPYLAALKAVPKEEAYAEYLRQRAVHGKAPAFYLDCAGWFFKAGQDALACRIVSNLAEMKLEDVGLWRTMGWRLREAGALDPAADAFRHVLACRGEEPQSRRDLALVLCERGKARACVADLNEAAGLFAAAAFEPTARRSGRRGNDLQASVLALEELNGLIAWCAAHPAQTGAFAPPPMDAAFRRDLPLDLRIMLSWDTDETDVDLHVLEPDGEEAYYGHRRTSSGGFVSEDVTTGYGPEEYLRKTAASGVYKILANYYASHRQALSGAATVTATVYTDWGTASETRRILSFRLDKPKDKHPIGEITVPARP